MQSAMDESAIPILKAQTIYFFSYPLDKDILFGC
ncbi:hypothetical protein Mucpa_4541 [Mucilaginibacter paludis DSM 18603]|uniref:Uncharacterized protein n=1 Tax=Mucilaginibacter paludis DSM 18603 TaxID=714943 RepID=H1Y712_9SPHI|nr:hypothetical protein Mucpa_4541 [Mucilaginibacter paludis DSM 18603]